MATPAPVPAQKKADLLHPLTSLDWTSTKHIGKDVSLLDHEALQTVWLNEKLYIVTESHHGDLILCCDSDMQLLTTIKCPTRESALTTYQGRLVLVGGEEGATRHPTNKLWSLQDDGTWAEDLPPMLTWRFCATAVSTGHHLLVAGGMGESTVEVFDGKRWSTTEPLPVRGHDVKSALLNGEWYLMGRWIPHRSVFSASVAALLASAGTGERTHFVWKKLPEAPLAFSSPTAFCSLLLAIGGRGHRGRRSDAIYAFIPDTQSWLHVADLPEPMLTAFSLALPSGDLVVVNKEVSQHSIFKASLKVDSFPDGRLSVAALECLQYAAGVQLFLSIGTKWTLFARLIGMEYSPIRQSPEECGRQLIEKWLKGKSDEPANWMSLVEILMMSKETYSLANTISIFFGTQVDTSDRYTRILQKLHRQTEEVENRDSVVETMMAERERAVAERDKAVAERDRAVAERDRARTDNVAIRSERAQLAVMHQNEASTAVVGYLRGVDVVAETSFEVTSQAHTFEWRGYGVKLHIQQDSLPADCPLCRVEMRASLSGQYALPVDCELVSGVYWVYCPVKLSKHATLEVQHCSTQREGLSFVRAECTQEQLPYVFRRLEGGVFSEYSSYGSIELSRFSGWGILKRIRSVVPHQYSAQVYYSDDIRNTWKVLFAIRRRKNFVLEDTIFRSKLEAFTGLSISKPGPLFPLEFTADRIELEIPHSLTGWSIICLSHPAILRSIVDSFRARPGDLVPHCQISVSGTAADVGDVLNIRLNLAGAKEPYNYFTLQCGPTTAKPGPAPQPQPVRPSEPARPADNQRPSVQQQQSPELVVFQEKRLILHTGILNNIQDIARRAFARSLIPGGVSRIITDTLNHLTADERTDQLLKELESRVKIDPAVLMKFVDVLRDSDAACYSTLITTITEALDTPPAEQQQH